MVGKTINFLEKFERNLIKLLFYLLLNNNVRRNEKRRI